jgi:hypothetical protein
MGEGQRSTLRFIHRGRWTSAADFGQCHRLWLRTRALRPWAPVGGSMRVGLCGWVYADGRVVEAKVWATVGWVWAMVAHLALWLLVAGEWPVGLWRMTHAIVAHQVFVSV